MKIIKWDIKKENITRESVIWNIISSGLNSVVSVFLLWVVTWVNNVEDAGIFSLGFATSQMMLTVGNYGMRNFQASDIKEKYSMNIYLASRIVTSTLMMIFASGFVLVKGYGFEKAIITILLCVLRITDAFDDVYGGYFQKKGRLDISGKIMSGRIFSYVIAFSICLIVTNDLILSCLVAIVAAVIMLSVMVFSTKRLFGLHNPKFQWRKIKSLLYECGPLCICAYLFIYLGNAQKYSIDLYMGATEQAYYTYLFMPCFVTNLFVGFALQPMIVKLSDNWLCKKYDKFIKEGILILSGGIIISIIVVVGGSLVGCQILSFIFGVSLLSYRKVLAVLLIGGAFYAFAVIAQVILTVMRRQIYLLIGFGGASIVALSMSNLLVQRIGLLGAGYAYLISSLTLFIILLFMIIVFMLIELKRKNIVTNKER